MMKLYWAPRTRSLRALWVLEEAGVPYERVRLDLSAGEQKSAEFRAINPMAKVPALTDGTLAIAESGSRRAVSSRPFWRSSPMYRSDKRQRDSAISTGFLTCSKRRLSPAPCSWASGSRRPTS
jgi:hypothetical protein